MASYAMVRTGGATVFAQGFSCACFLHSDDQTPNCERHDQIKRLRLPASGLTESSQNDPNAVSTKPLNYIYQIWFR